MDVTLRKVCTRFTDTYYYDVPLQISRIESMGLNDEHRSEEIEVSDMDGSSEKFLDEKYLIDGGTTRSSRTYAS